MRKFLFGYLLGLVCGVRAVGWLIGERAKEDKILRQRLDQWRLEDGPRL